MSRVREPGGAVGCAAQVREQNLPRGASLGHSLVLPECVERPLPTLLQLLSPYCVPDAVFHAGDTRWVRRDARETPVGWGDGQGSIDVTQCHRHCHWGSGGPHSLARNLRLILEKAASPLWPLEASWTPLPTSHPSAPSRVSRSALKAPLPHCRHAGLTPQVERS